MLDNDEDEDGDQLEITDVGNPSNGTAVAIDDDGDGVKDAISYTPSNSPDTVTFEYTISDGNGGTDTAEVTVNVTGDKSSCGPLTVRVEDPNGNLVPGVGFEPKYDGNNNGEPEQLPKRGMATGKFTYPVEVDDDPSLSKMNEDLITEFPDGFATSVYNQRKKVEQTLTPSGPIDEPDDHTYQNVSLTKSKLATDPSGPPPPPPENEEPNASFSINSRGPQGQCKRFDASGSSDDDGEITGYDWSIQQVNGSTEFTSSKEVYDLQFAEQSSWDVTLTVTDNDGATDTATGGTSVEPIPQDDNTDCSSKFDDWKGDDEDGGGSGGGGGNGGNENDNNPPPAAQ